MERLVYYSAASLKNLVEYVDPSAIFNFYDIHFVIAYSFMFFRYECRFAHFALFLSALNIYYPILILSI